MSSAPSESPVLSSMFRKSVLCALLAFAACGEATGPAPGDPAAAQHQLDVIIPGPIEIAPLKLVAIHYQDWATKQWRSVPKSGGSWQWPSPYDLTPSNVHFTWSPEGSLTSADIPNLNTQTGYVLEMYLGAQKLARTTQYYTSTTSGASPFDCPAGKTCLLTSIHGSVLFPVQGTWDLKVKFWKTPSRDPDVKSILAYVLPNPTPKSYFVDKIAPIFQHGRCSTCHSMGSKAAIVKRHEALGGAVYESMITESPSPLGGTRLRCGSGCHGGILMYVVPGETFAEKEWMTPKFDVGIDWTGKTPAQICATVKQKLPTAEATNAHFFEDARIAWAVHSGEVPGAGGQLPKAPPGDFFALKDIIFAWTQGGRPCP